MSSSQTRDYDIESHLQDLSRFVVPEDVGVKMVPLDNVRDLLAEIQRRGSTIDDRGRIIDELQDRVTELELLIKAQS